MYLFLAIAITMGPEAPPKRAPPGIKTSIRSVQFVGTPEYSAKVASLPVNFQQAKLKMFLYWNGGADHFAIVNDYYLFGDSETDHFYPVWHGIGVQGTTGEVRELSFQGPGLLSPWFVSKMHEWKRKYEGRHYSIYGTFGEMSAMRGYALPRQEPDKPYAPPLQGQEEQDRATAELERASDAEFVKTAIDYARYRGWLVEEELLRRGERSIPILQMLLETQDNGAIVIAFDVMVHARFKADLTVLAPTILQMIDRVVAKNDAPYIGYVATAAKKCYALIGPDLEAMALDTNRSKSSRQFVIELIGLVDSPTALPMLVKLLHDPTTDYELFPDIIYALLSLETERERANGECISLMKSDRKDLKLLGCLFAGAFSSDYRNQAFECACVLLSDPDVELRRFAAAAIREMQPYRCEPNAVAKFVELLDSPDEETAVIAAFALKSFEDGTEAALPTLDRLAAKATDKRKNAARRAAVKVRERVAHWEKLDRKK